MGKTESRASIGKRQMVGIMGLYVFYGSVVIDIVFENKWTMEGVIVELGICLEQNIQKKLSEK